MGTLNLGRRFAPLVYLEGIISPWKRNWGSNNMVFIFESAHDCEVCIVKCFGGSCCQPFWDVIISDISALHCNFCYWVFVQVRFFSSVLVCSKLIFSIANNMTVRSPWTFHQHSLTNKGALLFCTSFVCPKDTCLLPVLQPWWSAMASNFLSVCLSLRSLRWLVSLETTYKEKVRFLVAGNGETKKLFLQVIPSTWHGEKKHGTNYEWDSTKMGYPPDFVHQ